MAGIAGGILSIYSGCGVGWWREHITCAVSGSADEERIHPKRALAIFFGTLLPGDGVLTTSFE